MAGLLRTRRWFKSIALVLLGFGLATQLLMGAVFVHGAVERAEFYSGHCSSADPDCRPSVSHGIHLEYASSATLNLVLHLSGTLACEFIAIFLLNNLADVYNSTPACWSLAAFPARIFHPPRSQVQPLLIA